MKILIIHGGKRKFMLDSCPDMHDHLETLKENDRLVTIDEEISKDTEIHPLVRWQYRGGIRRKDRKAFHFTNVTDAQGYDYDISVTVGALAANSEIYGLGLGVDPSKSREAWDNALENQVEPIEVDSKDASAHELVYEGDDLEEEGQALDGIPVPISTPGWDNAPYTTASYVITHDPETGTRNVGNYRAQIKTRTRTGINPHPTLGQGAYEHWKTAKERDESLPVAISVSAPPVIGYSAIQKFSYEVDELAAAGGLVDTPIREVKAKTQPVMVPADADIIIEGEIRTDVLEPEAPFGESHGYMNPQQYNPIIEVTGITRRDDAIYTSIISQLTPSESSSLKVAPYEALLKKHLIENCSITGLKDVGLHEPLTSVRKVTILQMESDAKPSEIWRALHSAASFRPDFGKLTVAVDEDIDPHNPDAVFWAMGYRSRPHQDIQIIEGKDVGHVPRDEVEGEPLDSAVLWDATLKEPKPPVSLPKKEYMEHARDLWARFDLPELSPEMPWYGYSLGQWNDRLRLEAERAVEGRYFETGEELEEKRVPADHCEINTAFYSPEDFSDEVNFSEDFSEDFS